MFFTCYEGYAKKHWRLLSWGRKIVKSWIKECLETKTTKREKLKNIDIIKHYSYGYKILILYFDLTYLLYVKTLRSLDLRIRNYENFNN